MAAQKLKLGFLFSLVFCTSLVRSFSQEINPNKTIVSEEDWLPSRTINAIFQDSEGLIWVGTTNGLYKYDGARVSHYATKPNKENAIFTNLVYTITEDSEGKIIIGLESGLSSYNKKTGKFKTLSKKIQKYSKAWADPYQRVWMSIGHLGAFVSDRVAEKMPEGITHEQLSIRQAQEHRIGSINDFETANKEHLFLATSNGIFNFDLLTKSIVQYDFDYEVSTCQKIKGKEYLLGTKENGLFHVLMDNYKLEILGQYHFGSRNDKGNDRITSISIGKYSDIMVSTSKGVYQGHLKSKGISFVSLINDKTLLADNNFLTTLIDDTGVYWVGSLRGLYRVSPSQLEIERLRVNVPSYSPLNQQVRYLFKEKEQKYWVGTADDGFFILNPETKQFRKVNFTKPINRIYKSEKGYLLGINKKEVFKIQGTIPQPYLRLLTTSHRDISEAVEVAPGEWWMGCNSEGVLMYDDDGQGVYNDIFHKVSKQFHPTSSIFTMLKDSKGNVWIGSKGDGLLRANLVTGEVVKYSGIGVNGEISRRILHLKETKSGSLWISTREGGLYHYEYESDSFKQFTTSQGLPSNVISAVAEDHKGNVIVSTNNGLAVYDKNSIIPFRTFKADEGVIHSDFSFNSVLEGDQEDVYFGSSSGLIRVKRREVYETSKSNFLWSSVVPLSSEITTSEEAIKNYLQGLNNTEEGLELTAYQNSFEVSFALLNFHNPTKNAYVYRMKGFVEEWTPIVEGQPSVKLINVPHGDYIFEVRAEDSFGVALDKTQVLPIRVLSPFWLSDLAYFLYALCAFGLIVATLFVLKRWRGLQQKLKEEESLVAMKDQQMVYFADLSHEIKNRLSMILGPLENALSGKKVNQAVLNNLYQQTYRLKRISDQIMDLRQSKGGEFLLQVAEGDVLNSLKKLCGETQPLAFVRNISLDIKVNETEEKSWYDEELLEIITLNLLNNAIKYTPSGGTVELRAEVTYLSKSDLPDTTSGEGLYLCCKVNDTGIGIPSKEIKNLFNRFYRASNVVFDKRKKGSGVGLSLVGRLLKKHRGFIDINSEEGDGTRVSFFLPLEKSHYQLNEIKLSGSEINLIIEGSVPEYDILDQTRSTILLADDNVEILSFLEEHLQAEFNIIKCCTGMEAWNKLQEVAIDLIVSDLSMPEMDGLELMHRVKNHPTLKHLPFIILTGRNSHPQKLACIQNGVDDFVDKPFSLELVTWRIKALLYNRSLLRKTYSKKINVEPKADDSVSPDEVFIQQVVGFIEENLKNNKLSVEFLAEQCCMSRATFYRKMESLMGEAPSTFIRTYRLKKAAKLLQSGNYYISEVAYQTGFSTPKYFSKCFQKEFGSTPTEYVKKLTELSSN